MSVSLATEWLLAHSEEEASAILASHSSTSDPASEDANDEPSDEPMDVDHVSAESSTEMDDSANEGLKVLQEFHALSFQPDPKVSFS